MRNRRPALHQVADPKSGFELAESARLVLVLSLIVTLTKMTCYEQR